MRPQWKCDKCPTMGHLSPLTTRVLENGKIKMTSLRVQDRYTGKMINQPVPVTQDSGTRITIVQLRVGDESVAVQLCKKCLDNFRTKFSVLWNDLEAIVNA